MIDLTWNDPYVEFPIPKDGYIKLVKLYIMFGCFDFQGAECMQINGLSMGSPLSAVLANLCMEIREKEHHWTTERDNVIMLTSIDT